MMTLVVNHAHHLVGFCMVHLQHQSHHLPKSELDDVLCTKSPNFAMTWANHAFHRSHNTIIDATTSLGWRP